MTKGGTDTIIYVSRHHVHMLSMYMEGHVNELTNFVEKYIPLCIVHSKQSQHASAIAARRPSSSVLEAETAGQDVRAPYS